MANIELTEQQKTRLERLHENESLTDNLTDPDAKALLEWAEQQIRSDTDSDLVTAAVQAANQSGEEGTETLLTTANTFLARELETRASNPARENEMTSPMTMGQSAAPTRTEGAAPSESETTMSATPVAPAPPVQADGAIGNSGVLAARADASLAPSSPPTTTAKKPRRKRKPRKKS